VSKVLVMPAAGVLQQAKERAGQAPDLLLVSLSSYM
jgi:hypothetical protein